MIVCLGWGSLIWDPKKLPIQRKWFHDGPFMPIDFLRHSSNDRITLVINEDSKLVRVLWAIMDTNKIEAAREQLRKRENIPPKRKEWIGSWEKGQTEPKSIINIEEWCQNRGIDAVIWTDLPPKFEDTNGNVPSINQVIDHLGSLEGDTLENAKEYIQKAPIQIDTEYRRQIEDELGWTPLRKSH